MWKHFRAPSIFVHFLFWTEDSNISLRLKNFNFNHFFGSLPTLIGIPCCIFLSSIYPNCVISFETILFVACNRLEPTCISNFSSHYFARLNKTCASFRLAFVNRYLISSQRRPAQRSSINNLKLGNFFSKFESVFIVSECWLE